VRIVDAHHHLWDLSVREQDWITADELAPLRRDFLLNEYATLSQRAGVSASVVVQTVAVPEETPELLGLAAHSTLIAGVVGWTDLNSPDVAEQIGALKAQPGAESSSAYATRSNRNPTRVGSLDLKSFAA
jgi:L-fuconolactonase